MYSYIVIILPVTIIFYYLKDFAFYNVLVVIMNEHMVNGLLKVNLSTEVRIHEGIDLSL